MAHDLLTFGDRGIRVLRLLYDSRRTDKELKWLCGVHMPVVQGLTARCVRSAIWGLPKITKIRNTFWGSPE